MATFKKDLISVIISKTLIIVFGLMTTIIIARTLGPEKNGIIASLLVYPVLFMSIGSLGVRQSTAFFLGKKIYKENELKKSILHLWFFNSVISMVACFFLIKFFSSNNLNNNLIFTAIAPIPFSLFNTYNSGIFLGKNEVGIFSKVNWIPKSVIFILTLYFILYINYDIQGYLLALIGGPFIMFIFLLYRNKFLDVLSLKPDWRVLKDMFKLGSVYAFSLLIINLNYKIDIILLDFLSSPFETGIYSKGSSITEYLWEIPMLLSTIVFSRSAISKEEKKFSMKVAQLLRISLFIIGFGLLALFLLSEYIILGMFGDDFKGSILVLNYLIPGVFFLTIFKVMNMDLAGKGKPWVSSKAMIPALLINVIMNFILIPKIGANGAAISSTLSYSFASLLFLYLYSRETGISISEIITFKKTDFTTIKNFFK